MKKKFLAAACVALFAVGCYTPSRTPASPSNQVNLTVLTGDVGLAPKVRVWITEVQRRYDDAIIINGHGGTKVIEGVPTWCIFSSLSPAPVPIKDVIEHIRRTTDPTRRIVILCCNPDGLALDGVKNVSYSVQNVWVYPDALFSQAQNLHRDLRYGDGCGDINEFVEQ